LALHLQSQFENRVYRFVDWLTSKLSDSIFSRDKPRLPQ
jgi:hypothetical protein